MLYHPGGSGQSLPGTQRRSRVGYLVSIKLSLFEELRMSTPKQTTPFDKLFCGEITHRSGKSNIFAHSRPSSDSVLLAIQSSSTLS